MRNVILVLGLLLALSADNATAEDSNRLDSTRRVLDIYDKILLPADRKSIEELISGIEIGLLWANARLVQKGQPPLYCQPPNLTLTIPQIIDMMRRAMKDTPKSGDFPLGMMALFMFQRAFPCQ